MRAIWTKGVIALMVVALLGAACGGDEAPQPTDEPTETDQPTDEPTTGEPTDGGGVTVTANNFAFTPTEVTIASGDTITVRNGNPNTPHTFTVDGTDVDIQVNGGEAEEETIELDPGSYDFHCSFHGQMQGTLTVT